MTIVWRTAIVVAKELWLEWLVPNWSRLALTDEQYTEWHACLHQFHGQVIEGVGGGRRTEMDWRSVFISSTHQLEWWWHTGRELGACNLNGISGSRGCLIDAYVNVQWPVSLLPTDHCVNGGKKEWSGLGLRQLRQPVNNDRTKLMIWANTSLQVKRGGDWS